MHNKSCAANRRDKMYLPLISLNTMSYTCHESASGLFRLALRLNRQGDTLVTALRAYTTGANDVPVPVSTDIVLADTTCGFTNTGSEYMFLFRAEGTIQYYTLKCDTNSLIANGVSSAKFQTTAVKSNLLHRANPLGVSFQVVEADGSYVPTNNVYIGQDIKLRLILNKGAESFGPDNWGYIFHTAISKDFEEDAELLLQIFTPGLGTEVKVEGQLPTSEFTCYAKVKRDDAVEISIPKAYADASSATLTEWVTSGGGIKVTSFHDRIGVKVIHRRPGTTLDAGRVVLPDDAIATLATGSTYVYSLHNSNAQQAQFGLVAFEDTTAITINYNEYTVSTETIDGAPASGPTDTVSLDEYQFLPKHTAAKRFVLPFPSSYMFEYEFDDPVNDQGYTIENPGATVTRAEGAPVFVEGDLNGASDALEIISANPIHVHGIVPTQSTQAGNGRAGFGLPSLEQWSSRQHFYAMEGKKYDLIFVSHKGDMDDIKIKLGSITTSFIGSTLSSQTGFSKTEVTRVMGETDPSRFEYYEHSDFQVTNTDDYRTECGLVEFQERSAEHECTDTTSDHTFSSRFAGSFSSKPGDLLDNDCDGFTDEEVLNGEDDDGDGDIDEDLALREIFEFKPVTESIGHFTLNTALSDVFDDYWVIETNPFSAFKVADAPSLFFGVKYEVCYDGDLPTTCAQPTIASCASAQRKRRDISGAISEHFASVHVSISGNRTDEYGSSNTKEHSKVITDEHSCEKDTNFWLSIAGLGAISLMELFMIGGMMWYKRHVMRLLHETLIGYRISDTFLFSIIKYYEQTNFIGSSSILKFNEVIF
ncbi:hypothetical protein MAR_002914 [Mya arenaria]|uniref:IgGFc-binding protein N-terminal domain-containing protein n=1 Tax=Mya arenaria TaxID=6604 RepID=A0ABY7G8G8_MYAAR|nr:hypothetical protein MAR_002914 [Mya arenaria]